VAEPPSIRILHGLSSDPSSAESKSIGFTTIYRFGAALHVRRHPRRKKAEVVRETDVL
jgi:hypothetical protein